MSILLTGSAGAGVGEAVFCVPTWKNLVGDLCSAEQCFNHSLLWCNLLKYLTIYGPRQVVCDMICLLLTTSKFCLWRVMITNHTFFLKWKVENLIQKWYKQASYSAADKIPIVLIHFIMNFNTIDKK